MAKELAHPVAETMKEIDARLRRTFAALTKVTKGVVAGHFRAAIVSGEAGCGKTYSLERELNVAQTDGKIRYDNIKGTMSPIGLYQALHKNQSKSNSLLIDDCDEIFNDLESLNILKASLDTGDIRMVHWNKESNILAAANIESPFEFEGSVFFVTNIDFMAEIAKGSKMAPHYKALIDRAIYVDLGIHSRREVLVRISQVVLEADFLTENQLTVESAKQMIKWLYEHEEKLQSLSIRTVIKLAAIVRAEGEWQDLAEVVMLRRDKYKLFT